MQKLRKRGGKQLIRGQNLNDFFRVWKKFLKNDLAPCKTLVIFYSMPQFSNEIGRWKTQSQRLVRNIFYLCSWRQVNQDDEDEFNYLEQEIHTNSSTASYTVEHLQPYTVYSFQVSALNHVGRSRPSKNSYPAITLRESKFISFYGQMNCKKIIGLLR